MQTDEVRYQNQTSEDMLAAISDIAASGRVLQRVLASGAASSRVADACGDLFLEITELAGAACAANAES